MRLRRNTLSIERAPEKKERSRAIRAFSRAARWAAAVLTGATFMLASPSSPVEVQKAQAQDPDKRVHKLSRTDKPDFSLPTPITDPPRFEVQSVAMPSSSGDELVGTSQPYSSPMLDRLCDGDQELARDMVRKTGELLLRFEFEGKYTPEQRREAGVALYDVLSQVPEGKEMHTSEGYSQAMQKLAGCGGGQGECDLWGAVKALKGETAFNALFDSVNNIYAIAVDQVATPIMQVGFEVSFPIDTNKNQFTVYRLRGDESGFFLKPLSVDIGLNWRWFLLGGELMQLKLNVDEDGEIFFAREGGKVLKSNDAHAIGLKLSLPFGWSIAGYPLVMAPFVSAGWMSWELGADVRGPDGTTEPLDIGQNTFFLDFTGIEFRFPGSEAEDWPCRPERLAVGIAGITPQHIYPLGHLTGSCHYGDTAGTEWKTYLTLEYGSVMNIDDSYDNVVKEHRFGFDWKPAIVVYQTSRYVELSGGLSFRYTVNVRPEHENYAGETVGTSTSHIFAPSGLFSVRFKWWSKHPMAVEARFGYIWEYQGPKGETIPELAGAGTPFGSLNVVVPLW